MKKSIGMAFGVFALTLCVFVGSSQAAFFQALKIGVDIDYAKAKMAQVNEQLNKSVTVSSFGSGVSAMLNVDLVEAPFLMIGVRSGYLYLSPANATFKLPAYEQITTVNASLIPIEAGLSINLDLPSTPISFTAGVYGGYGFGFASYRNDISALGQTASFTQPYRGGNFMGELLATINFKWSKLLSLNLNGGYRSALIPKMTQSSDVSYTAIPFISIPVGSKGEAIKDSSNQDLVFDFSGINIGVGLSLVF